MIYQLNSFFIFFPAEFLEQIALEGIGREPRPKEMVQIMADMETKHGN